MKAVNSVNVERFAPQVVEDFLTGVPNLQIISIERDSFNSGRWSADIKVKAQFAGKPLNIVIEVKATGQPQIVRNAAQNLQRYLQNVHEDDLPVVMAPYLSPQARAVCREENVGYLDYLGNALIASDGLYIERSVPGRPESERRSLRSMYKPKATRVLRCLLRHPSHHWRISDLAEAAKVSAGLASNVGARIREFGWAELTDDGLVLIAPADLLDSWAENYQPPKGEVYHCYTPYHGRQLTDRVRAATGHGQVVLASFSAAEWLAPFVRHPNNYIYADEPGFVSLTEAIDLKPVSKGGNIVVVLPEEDGVLDDAIQVSEGLRATSAVQTYLDLCNSGDRGKEGAQFLRSKLMDWQI